MRIDVLTLFPPACEPFFAASILGRAQSAGRIEIVCHNIRDYTTDVHRKVDDRPFGGGPGMVLMCQPLVDAVEAVERMDARPAQRVLLSPRGERFSQACAAELSRLERLLLIAGHYEGVDERVCELLRPRELSIGDYVLSGGEAAAMVVVDAVARLLPGVVGHPDGAADESFTADLLEYPHYTRPREYRGLRVPDVLVEGNHAAIAEWRKAAAERITQERRPDMRRQAD
ncbi:MAG: tRNA (guanosine(37)-N1)-methyltransferase TrmD [Phycisphaerae bacterium]